jgi:hypothetical protein
MFGRKNESKSDMRDGMLEKGPARRSDFGEDRPSRRAGPQIVSPELEPQAEGQTTHE